MDELALEQTQEQEQESESTDSGAFTIYALVCPRTMQVRYVGQTSRDLKTRMQSHVSSQHQGPMQEWLESLAPERPLGIVLERGKNRLVRLKSSWRIENRGNGDFRPARVGVRYSTVRETVWQKRFHRTLFNWLPVQSPEVAALLCNPPLPWTRLRSKCKKTKG